MPAFFRKERPHIFEQRFRRPAGNAPCQLRGNLVFQAKNAGRPKTFRIRVANRDYDLVATVSAHDLVIQNQRANPTATLTINRRLTEADMASAVRGQLGDAVMHAAVKKLCQDHATSSAHSPFISGTIVDNFAASRTYPGDKLSIDLNFRQPFSNPWASGNEREFFLIGSVSSTDCRIIKYYGNTAESLNEIVRLPGSNIPRPA